MKEQNNKKSKIIGISIALLVIILLIIVAVFSFNKTDEPNKNTQEMFGSLMSNVIEHPNLNGFNNIEVANLKVLNEVKIYDLKEDNKGVNKKLETNYPIMVDDEIILIFSEVKINGKSTASLGTEFAPLLNIAKQNGVNEVKVIKDGYTFYAISDDKVYKQEGDLVTEISKEEMDFLSLDNVKTTYLNDVNDKLTKRAISACENDKNK